jgi:16S rRNA C967 or C1407 C5-methylase (RsmB/RsmF family)
MLKVAYELFPDEEERDEFIEVLHAGESKDQALIVMENRPEMIAFPRQPRLAWQPSFVERIDESFKASKHPFYKKGFYYSLDFSSVFSASAMLALPERPTRILDMCAAPGGKSVFAYRAFRPDLLLCNEIIKSRAGILLNNLARCKCETSALYCTDTTIYARKFRNVFDLVIVDAPCSGQSLLAKGDEAPECWDPAMIDMCMGRQRRILTNSVSCVQPGGYLLYTTCTFTIKENEKVIDWCLKNHPEMEVVEVPHLSEYQSKLCDYPAYRLFPHQAIGAGAFVCLLRKKPGEEPFVRRPIPTFNHLWKYGEPLFGKQVDTAPTKEDLPPQLPRKRRQHFPIPDYVKARKPRPVYKGRSSGVRHKKPK